MTVSTADVDKLAAAGAKTATLVQAGVVLADNSNIAYKFTGLNALKPDMITEATRNARASADRFAADSGSAVGVIRASSPSARTGPRRLLPMTTERPAAGKMRRPTRAL